jgi:hypothetical protein
MICSLHLRRAYGAALQLCLTILESSEASRRKQKVDLMKDVGLSLVRLA